jgi:hypothetical protein
MNADSRGFHKSKAKSQVFKKQNQNLFTKQEPKIKTFGAGHGNRTRGLLFKGYALSRFALALHARSSARVPALTLRSLLISGAGDGNRTRGLLFKGFALSRFALALHARSSARVPALTLRSLLISGAGDGNRTRDQQLGRL